MQDTLSKTFAALADPTRRAMLEHGPHYIVKTVLNGETWLRCTFQNPLTADGDIEALLDRLEELNATLA